MNDRRAKLGAMVPWVVAAIVALPACDSKVDSIDHPSGTVTSGGPYEEETEHPLETEDAPPPPGPASYADCLLAVVSPEEASCLGGGYSMASLKDACVACTCHDYCATDDHCTPPSGVTAEGECRETGLCTLWCDGGRSCPEGMVCGDAVFEHTPPDGRYPCVWVTDDEFVCNQVFGEPTNPCAGIVEAGACNAKVSQVGGDRCAWVEENIVASGSTTCDPAGVEGRCVWVQAIDGCDGTDACPSADARVHWRDLGAGTVGLTTFPCDLRPSRWEEYESCDFTGAATIPLVCECGCE